MIELTGYQTLDRIYSGTRTLVYRGTRLWDKQPVAIKVLRNEYPSFNELLHFRNQYTISKNLNFPGIIQTYSLEPYHNGYALIVEDFGGISLKEWTGFGKAVPSLVEFFQIAIALGNTLDILYRHRIIHKDIKPANILINPETKEVKLIDFSIASLLPRSNQTLINPKVLEGTLGYLSPEQTGRMNRGIDYRSDFYSLGVTFYELLTGELPFQSHDPMELVHSHIAKQPPSLHEINPEIGPVLSQIVSKLMAKNAEDRYQSALGLKQDIEKCRFQWQETGNIVLFELGKRDICDRFTIPEKLYGRETEVETLLNAFDRVATPLSSPLTKGGRRRGEMMLVAGFSGIGKTAVVNEVHKPIVRQRGYFIKGKFDQFNRNIPFSAFVQAFRDLMGQLLSESDAQLQNWKTQILEAVGENGQVIIEVIPELELIISPQPPGMQLSGTSAQNRFNLLFQNFIQVFTTQDHPLVMFLDDLQWADSASLNLMQLLMVESTAGYLLMIGAYRDNEVFAAHPLMVTLAAITHSGATVNQITLQPLSDTSLNELVANTLNCSTALAQPLTDLVFQKTQGNPFFATQFMKALHQDRLISFDTELGHWECDLAKVRSAALTDDVVEFMALQLQKLPKATQTILQLAACIGNSFDLSTLAIVSEQTEPEAATYLWKALQEGLILPESEVYKFYLGAEQTTDTTHEPVIYRFLHDRIQQAAYSLIPESAKKATHLKIGQLLLAITPQLTHKDNIFEIVNQLNIGVELIADREQLNHLVSLNLLAGKKAKAATAYADAARYLNISWALLESDSWQTQYDLTLAVYIETAEAEYLNGNFYRLESLAKIVLIDAHNLLDMINIYELRIQAYQSQSMMTKAIDIGLEALEKLGINLDTSISDRAMPELPRIEDLDNIPEMTDPQQLAALRILMTLYPPIYIARPEMIRPLILTMVNLALEGGHSGLAAYGYVLYGMILCAAPGGIEQGYHAGKLALKLLDKFHATALKARLYTLFNAHIRFWKEPAKATLTAFIEGCQSGLETGDLEWASYNSMHYCKNLFVTGERLEIVEAKQAPYLELILKNKHDFALSYAQIWAQATLNLQGKSSDKLQLIGERFDELHFLQLWQSTNNYMSLFALYVAKANILYLFKEYASALDCTLLAGEYIQAAIGLIALGVYNFYHSLILLALYPQAEPNQQQQYLLDLDKNQAKLREWSDSAPQNFLHKYWLIQAEQARVFGNVLEAMEFYDQAIQGAKDTGYLQEEALANELAAEFYLDWGKEKVAVSYLEEAYYCYSHWGAKAKTDDLEKRYPQILTAILQSQQPRFLLNENLILNTNRSSISHSIIQTTYSRSSSISDSLDFATILKASQALSGEIQLEQLISTLVQIVMKNAGADKCDLILLKGENLFIEATAAFGKKTTDNQAVVRRRLPVDSSQDVPTSIINYVSRTQQTVVIDNAAQTSLASDAYIQKQKPKSLLCTPIINQGKLIGILYLENRLTQGVFTSDRLQVIELLMAQAAISLQNAQLYSQLEDYSYTLEQKVEERTQELQEKATQLEATLQKLYATQSQLIQTEKMSSLGQLVAGIAHEINNPVNFIHGNLNHVDDYMTSLIELIDLYQEVYPQSPPEIQAKIAEIDLEFLLKDLPKILGSMTTGTERIRLIIESLRNFSRLDESEFKPIDIHSGIDSTLLILQHRLKANDKYQEIQALKEYGQLPLINCYASALNQVFMNILSNAIDALRQAQDNEANFHKKPTIRIQTWVDGDRNAVIRIADNGIGIEPSAANKIFEPFFTTKPVGKGTGLGLSVSYSIIVDKHGGRIDVNSTLGEGTEFTIVLPIL
ncbi:MULTISPECIES: AAA family ATPase [unclassified Microcoleus]|uniref:trifunctional serine/threonine-protein kinase/ATP-binding protein/sensor histidine kinase n=1 Tax=unclassified Microcoleus TaxID=2642155 RepID=UPI002FD5EFDF